MAVRKNALLTADDYRALPEGSPRYQLIQGELYMAPAPNRDHQKISGNIYYLLRRYLESRSLGEIYTAPFDVFLTDHDVFQPDLVYVANDRESVLNDEGAVGPPTLVVEILSASTARHDRSSKKRTYATAGVDELWLVDPSTRTIEVFRLGQNPNQAIGTYGVTEQFSSNSFPGLSIKPAEIF